MARTADQKNLTCFSFWLYSLQNGVSDFFAKKNMTAMIKQQLNRIEIGSLLKSGPNIGTPRQRGFFWFLCGACLFVLWLNLSDVFCHAFLAADVIPSLCTAESTNNIYIHKIVTRAIIIWIKEKIYSCFLGGYIILLFILCGALLCYQPWLSSCLNKKLVMQVALLLCVTTTLLKLWFLFETEKTSDSGSGNNNNNLIV